MPEFIELSHDGIITTSDEAVYFRFIEKQIWIPKSLLGDWDENTVEVQYWYAEDNELEEFEI